MHPGYAGTPDGGYKKKNPKIPVGASAHTARPGEHPETDILFPMGKGGVCMGHLKIPNENPGSAAGAFKANPAVAGPCHHTIISE